MTISLRRSGRLQGTRPARGDVAARAPGRARCLRLSGSTAGLCDYLRACGRARRGTSGGSAACPDRRDYSEVPHVPSPTVNLKRSSREGRIRDDGQLVRHLFERDP